MGILQKSSLRLTFGFTLALAIGVLLNVGLSTPSWAASSYTRVNNQTVKFSVTADVPGQSLVPTTYFVADGLVMGNDKFWAIKESSNNTAYCQLWIDMSVNGANRWTRNSIARVSGKCADKTDTYNISVNDSGASIFFSQATSGVIGPALKGSSAFEFKKVLNTTGLELTVGLNIYIQTSPTAGITCPRLLVQYASNRWGFIAPLNTGQPQTNSESSYYQQILDNYPSTRGTGRNCNANNDSGVHKSSEQALAQLIGGTATDWGSQEGLMLKFISFKNLTLSVKQMGNAVGDPSAAEIRLGTTPAGSINGTGIATGADGSTNTSKTTCAIDGIGWIVCPVMKYMGDITDMAFNFLANNFLETDSRIISDPVTKNAWSVMRTLANIAFVIAFLIIIFSQLTSVGITNYGVKKMLPRLVIAAILVNVSFLLCQIAVDISNILGYSLKSLFDSLQTYIKIPGNATDASDNVLGVSTMIAGLIAGGVTLAFALSVPVLLAALLALLLIVLILFGRTALIVMLVIVSPLAFVAYLLPNTEQWFKKWWKMFSSLLLLFPIIAVVFGASSLTSGIIANLAQTDAEDTKNMMLVVALGVAAIPLFAVPALLKSAMGAAGTIGTKLSGLSSKMNGKVNTKGKQSFGESRLGQYKKFRATEGAQRKALIQSGTYSGKGGKFNPRNLLSGANKGINENKLSGKFGDRSSSQGNALQDAQDAELMKNAGSRLDYFKQPNGNPLSQAQMMQVAKGEDVTDTGLTGGAVVGSAKTFDVHTRKAAIQRATKIATVPEAQDLVDASVSMTAGERLTLTSALPGTSAAGKAPWLMGKTLGDITQGTANVDFAAHRAIMDGKVTAEAFANGDKASMQKLIDVTASDPVARALLIKTRDDYLLNPLLSGKIAKGSEHDILLRSI